MRIISLGHRKNSLVTHSSHTVCTSNRYPGMAIWRWNMYVYTHRQETSIQVRPPKYFVGVATSFLSESKILVVCMSNLLLSDTMLRKDNSLMLMTNSKAAAFRTRSEKSFVDINQRDPSHNSSTEIASCGRQVKTMINVLMRFVTPTRYRVLLSATSSSSVLRIALLIDETVGTTEYFQMATSAALISHAQVIAQTRRITKQKLGCDNGI
mmetsp:Transcript_107061/g.341653  ORF Transcript_107061/g.341653 Transcript_107061/m.341653 type:complete len:210 (-) Transcript_107061:624-1253(-)